MLCNTCADLFFCWKRNLNTFFPLFFFFFPSQASFIITILGWILPVVLSGFELFAPLHILHPIPLVMIFGSLVGLPLLQNVVLYCLCDIPIFVCATRNAALAVAAEEERLAKKKQKLERQAEDKRKAIFRKQAVEQLRHQVILDAANAKAQKLKEKARAAEELARKAQLAADFYYHQKRVHDDEESQDKVVYVNMDKTPKSLQSLGQPSKLQGLRVATKSKIQGAGASATKINQAVNRTTKTIVGDIHSTLRVTTQSNKQKAFASIQAAQRAGCNATKFQCLEVVEWMDLMPKDLNVLERGANAIIQICQDEQASDQRRMILQSRFAETGGVETLLRAVSYICTEGRRRVEFVVKRLLGGRIVVLKHIKRKENVKKQEELTEALFAVCDALRYLVNEHQQNAERALQFTHNGTAGDVVVTQAREWWSDWGGARQSPQLKAVLPQLGDFFNSTELVESCELVVASMKKNAAAKPVPLDRDRASAIPSAPGVESKTIELVGMSKNDDGNVPLAPDNVTESRLPSEESKDNDELTGQAKESPEDEPVEPPPQLTDALRTMVTDGILTNEQALSMLGYKTSTASVDQDAQTKTSVEVSRVGFTVLSGKLFLDRFSHALKPHNLIFFLLLLFVFLFSRCSGCLAAPTLTQEECCTTSAPEEEHVNTKIRMRQGMSS